MMIKRCLTIVAVIFATTVCADAQSSTIKKVYFDRNLKAVDHVEFAEYYRVESYTDSKEEPIIYRLYSRRDILLAEGSATFLDAKDHSKNIYIGENITYYDNGNIAERYILETPGPLDTADYYEAFDEDKQLLMKGTQKNGLFSGEIIDHSDDGKVYHYHLKNDVLQGELQVYNNDQLLQSTFFVDGKETGKRTFYFPSGKVSSVVNVTDGLENGIYESYDENGRVINRIPYKNGIPVGTVKYNMNDMDRPQTYSYYEMKTDEDAPFFISVYPSKQEYTVSDRRLTTRGGGKISGRRDHFNILRFDLIIQNMTDESMSTSIDNIMVVSYKKRSKPDTSNKRGDIYIDESTAREICVRHFSLEKEIAYENASNIAKAAATSRSSSFGAHSDSESASYSSTTNSASAAIGGGYSRFGAIGGGGYVFGGSRGGYAALGASSTRSSGTYSRYSHSSDFGSTSVFSGADYYQVLQAEKNKAEEYTSIVKQQSVDEIERLTTSSFSVPAKGIIQREIMASEDLEDIILLSFKINGHEYSLILDN